MRFCTDVDKWAWSLACGEGVGVHALFLSVLVSVLCWLSRSNLDAFLFPPVFWNILQSSTVISVETFKEFTSETI